MEMCMPREPKATPRNMASNLQIRWHNLAHFCCTEFGHSKFCLFLISPSLVPYDAPSCTVSVPMQLCSARWPLVSRGSLPDCQTAPDGPKTLRSLPPPTPTHAFCETLLFLHSAY